MANFKLEFDWDLTEAEQELVTLVMMQVEPQATEAVAAAVAAEREACWEVAAAVKTRIPRHGGDDHYTFGFQDAQVDICNAIRSRASGGKEGSSK
ncbi:MAG: hypothetical protein GWN58_01955 [Anaerolineae bacterium]|nr:hypothetical protein [Anaerolineae bacterium]